MLRSTAAQRAVVIVVVVALVVLSVAALFSLGGSDGSDGSDAPGSSGEATLQPTPLDDGSPTEDSVEPALRPFYEQELRWEACRGDYQCAELEVPLDYAEPTGETITVSVLKVPAGNRSGKVGALVVNPGGPGGSGVDYAANAQSYFGREVRAAFDIVGFDPRGVGESTPVDCLTDAELDEAVASDPDPETPAEAAEVDEIFAGLGQGCLDRSGDLARHVSTEEVARDVDVLRAALGEERLAYFGASYGTFLGATYADLFPSRVGRMVLDGAIDPSLSQVEMSKVQAEGFETALRAYLANCVDDGDCFLGDTVDAAAARVSEFFAEVDADPLPGAGGRELEIGNAVLGVWLPLYNEDYWSLLDSALQQAFDGDGAALLSFSDAYTGRGPGGYVDNSVEALYAVNCLDHPDAVPSDETDQYVEEFLEVSPTFGRIFAYGLSGCAGWPVEGTRVPGPLVAAGAAPILVVGTTRDPATPLEWAEALADQLESGVLLRRDGDGHTGYNAGNACVDRTVEAYLVSGRVPEGTVDC